MMKRRAFLTLDPEDDAWPAEQLREVPGLEIAPPPSAEAWRGLAQRGEGAVKAWIANQRAGQDCAILLIGPNTTKRPWIGYEIMQSWHGGIGLLGVHVHGLRPDGEPARPRGTNPLTFHTVTSGINLAALVSTYDPRLHSAAGVREHIRESLPEWVAMAIELRARIPHSIAAPPRP